MAPRRCVKILTAFYDLAVGPVSFDFVVFLMKAEIARRAAGADRLHMVIVPDPNGPGGFRDKRPFFDEHEARWRLWNICVPACALIGAGVTVAADWRQAKMLQGAAEDGPLRRAFVAPEGDSVFPEDWGIQTLKNRRHLVGDLITQARSGVAIPRLHASEHARRNVRRVFGIGGKPVVTMTLRNTYLPERNSDPEAWNKAAEHIRSRGFTVLKMFDTSSALSAGVGYGELNLDIRMACYQEAALNLQANNGAASLCWFSEKPYRMFNAGIPAEDWDGLFVKQGLPLGTSWPWGSAQQKLIYGPTSAEQIVAEFEQWKEAA